MADGKVLNHHTLAPSDAVRIDFLCLIVFRCVRATAPCLQRGASSGWARLHGGQQPRSSWQHADRG